MDRGEITELKSNLKNSFQKIKDDMKTLTDEIYQLKKDYKDVLQENIELKKQISVGMNKDIIEQIVKKTLENVNQKDPLEKKYLRKIRKNKSALIKTRILELANLKNMSVPEIKDVIVDQEQLCSKATFYRYIKKLQKRNLIDTVEIEEKSIVVRI